MTSWLARPTLLLRHVMGCLAASRDLTPRHTAPPFATLYHNELSCMASRPLACIFMILSSDYLPSHLTGHPLAAEEGGTQACPLRYMRLRKYPKKTFSWDVIPREPLYISLGVKRCFSAPLVSSRSRWAF